MARAFYDYDPPERFVAGTVGQPGSRTFFLQARTGTRITSVALEKAQVSILATRIDGLLDEVLRPGVSGIEPEVADNDPLETPIEEEFRVGTISLAWNADQAQVVIECFAEGIDPEIDADDGAVFRVALSPTAARAFARRALAVVSAGRPPCPFCEGPLDPEGHICPRANGYRR